MNHRLQRRGVLAATLVAPFLIAGCAYSTGARGQIDAQNSWQGRLSVRVDAAPVQTLSAAFELRGSPERGELTLASPLGTLLAQAHWEPGTVQWRTPQESRSFPDLPTLAHQLTGTPLPLAALFDWLHGIPTQVDGWEPDLRDIGQGRITAQRLSPAPKATVRVVLDR